jgi:hypothetical protein
MTTPTEELVSRLRPFVDQSVLDGPSDVACAACFGGGLVGFYESRSIPVQSTVLLDDETSARSFPSGDLLLAFCARCGLIQNVLFDEGLVDYSLPTEESQAFSETFQTFARGVAESLVSQYSLTGRHVSEIGCGKGDFLALMDAAGIGSGHGIDPGYLPNRELDGLNLTFNKGFYGPTTRLSADLFVARHFMEHMPNVHDYFSWMAQDMARSGEAALYVEVPDTTRVLKEGAFWDIYYEHCSYFTESSMVSAMRCAGLSPHSVELGFEGQYLMARALSGSVRQPHEADADLFHLIPEFVSSVAGMIDRWIERIQGHLDRGDSVAVWGGSSKTVSFLTALGLDGITVVDINPHKQGKWLPTAAVEVLNPTELVDINPALVVPMNPIYVQEITNSLHEMGLRPKVEAL